MSATISQGPNASEWFKGGLVAYQAATKQRLLGVSPGPVVSERCAREMARGARELLGTEVGIALTGVGGPEPLEGHEPGTVWISAFTPVGPVSRLLQLRDRPPSDVCTLSSDMAVELACRVLRSATS